MGPLEEQQGLLTDEPSLQPLASFCTVLFHSDAWKSAWSKEKSSWVGVRSPSKGNQSSPLVCVHCLAYAIRCVLFALTITEHSECREGLSSTVAMGLKIK